MSFVYVGLSKGIFLVPYYMVNLVPRDPGFYTLEPFKSFNYNPNSCNGETNEQIKNKKQQEKTSTRI